MAIEVITREDLNEFRSLLLNDLKEIIQSKPQQTKQCAKHGKRGGRFIQIETLRLVRPGYGLYSGQAL